MHAAFPMQREDEFSLRAIHIHKDLLDERADDALLQPRTGGWISPDRFQAAGELVKIFTSTYWIWIGRNTVLPDTHLDLAHTFEGQVPATLKFRSDESVLLF